MQHLTAEPKKVAKQTPNPNKNMK